MMMTGRRFTLICCPALALSAVTACGSDGREDAAATDSVIHVRRDDRGVVHVSAGSDEDAYYGDGYMQATDRLFQMDLMRRRALGRRAEVLGTLFLKDDLLVRRVQIAKLGEDVAATMKKDNPEHHARVEAWVNGVNARIDEVLAGAVELPYGFGKDELDYAPEHWAVSDPMAVGKLILFGNANQIQYDILTTIVHTIVPAVDELPITKPLRPTFIVPEQIVGMASAPLRAAPGGPGMEAGRIPSEPQLLPADAAARVGSFLSSMADLRPGASNNWALTGRLTDSGTPLLANDPHQPLTSPSLMWVHHMSTTDAGGDLDVVGFGFVGSPSVQLGHNRTLAWAATTTYPDVMDLWDVTVDGGKVSVGGKSVDLVAHAEQVPVSGEAAVDVNVEEVPGYGVLLAEDLAPIPIVPAGHRILLGWTGFRPTHEAVGFHGFDTARTLDDFESSVDRMEIALFNFLGATRDGISYRSSPLVPDHGKPSDAKPHYRLLDGADPETLWTGEYLDASKLPHGRGEKTGYVVTANNDPFGFTDDGRTDGDPFYFGVFFDPGTRAFRIDSEIARLISEGKVTPDTMKTLQGDTYSVIADDLVPIVMEVMATVEKDPALAAYAGRKDLADIASLLSTWDRRMVRASSEAVIFNALSFFTARAVVGDDLGPLFQPILDANSGYPIKIALLILTGKVDSPDKYLQKGRSVILMNALDETAAYLTARFGGTDPALYTWGDIHGTRFDGPWPMGKSVGWIPTDGGVGTVNVSEGPFLVGGEATDRIAAVSGPIFRSVTHFEKDGTPVAEVTFPPGNGGDDSSPFFQDHLADWAEHRYEKLLFSSDEIDEHTVEHLELRREPAPPGE